MHSKFFIIAWTITFVIVVCVYCLCAIFAGATEGTFADSLDSSVIVVATCNKFLHKALECQQRLEKQGLRDVLIINGDDRNYDRQKHYFKSMNFKAACEHMTENNIPYIAYFEEDAVLYSDRLSVRRECHAVNLITWGKNNLDKWDVLYLGCIAKNAVLPRVVDSSLALSSHRGQLGGHAMLISQCVASKFLSDHVGWNTPFDCWLTKQCLRSFQPPLAMFKQKRNPVSMREEHIVGDFGTYQDALTFLWPIGLLGLTIFLPVTIAVVTLNSLSRPKGFKQSYGA